jgi:hypothetical protein
MPPYLLNSANIKLYPRKKANSPQAPIERPARTGFCRQYGLVRRRWGLFSVQSCGFVRMRWRRTADEGCGWDLVRDELVRRRDGNAFSSFALAEVVLDIDTDCTDHEHRAKACDSQ